MIEKRPVVIVGNGPAAWMTAAWLDAAVNDRGFHIAEITVVGRAETPEGPGFASALPDLRRTVAVAGIDEAALLRNAGGTLCHAIRYAGWQNGSAWYLPFDRHRTAPLDTSGVDWLRSDRSIPFAGTVSAQPALCDAGIGPLPLPGVPDFPRLEYAYHLDEARLGRVLRDHAIARGTPHVAEDLADIELTDDGEIRAVITDAGHRVEGALFVDCTGPDARLVGERLGVPWIGCPADLPADRVSRLEVPYDRHWPGRVRPYTQVTARPWGYVREIPLLDRLVLEYVSSGRSVDARTIDGLLHEFAGVAAGDAEIRCRSFASGFRAKAWVGNCVAVGSSFAVIEPLASAAPSLAAIGAAMLAEHFPLSGGMPALAYRYNRILADRYLEIADFTGLHYALTRRDGDGFWRAAADPARRPERLAAKLEFWRHKPPGPADFEDQHFPGTPATPLPDGGLPGDHRPASDTGGLFGLASYEAALYASGFLDAASREWYGPERRPSQVLESVSQQLRHAQARLAPHDAWLRRVCGMPAYGPAGRDQA